jgi:hypothetical protein
MRKDIDTGCIVGDCLDALISFFEDGRKSSLFMDASGTRTVIADWERCRKVI